MVNNKSNRKQRKKIARDVSEYLELGFICSARWVVLEKHLKSAEYKQKYECYDCRF